MIPPIDQSDPGEAPIPLPTRFGLAGIEGHLDRCGPDLIDGWAIDTRMPSRPVEIELREAGVTRGAITANLWRTDLQEVRQGDGRWGFTALPPASLADGQTHRITLHRPDGQALLPGPIDVSFHSGADRAALPLLRPLPHEPDPPSRPRPHGLPAIAGESVFLSIIVVFFNMAREAARTLTSLSRAYQRGIGGLAYEVICIDNGSGAELDAAWVAGFGPEFRLIRAETAVASPIALMNAAAREARGRLLAIMIDGAHVLSPGVLREAAEAAIEAPEAVIALRQWFVGGDQRFLARSFWTRAQEDMLFDRIAWPEDGYGLFRISTPVWESPNHWFDGMSESNCLFVPAGLFAQIGGFDEAFDEPGAGYANLDLFRRAALASPEPVVALIGEASFHQFHDGTTTNVEHDEKERRVRGYATKYARLRGEPYASLHAGSIRLRGQIHARETLVARQRPLSPAFVGVTDAIRPAELAVHFDEPARQYLISVYAEAQLAGAAKWRGEVLGVAPPDALEIADIIGSVRPQRVIGVHLAAGLRSFVRDNLGLQGGGGRLVCIDAANPLAPEVLAGIGADIGSAADVLVLYATGTADRTLMEALPLYASFVSLRSYLIVAGSAQGQPWLGYSCAWTAKAINSFTDSAPFAVDHTRTRHFVTACPRGFLQRIGPVETGDGGAGLGLVGVS